MGEITDFNDRLKKLEQRMHDQELKTALDRKDVEHMTETMEDIKKGVSKINTILMRITMFVLLGFLGAIMQQVLVQ